MSEREKIAQIIAEHLCPQGKAHKTLYGAERMCYSRNNFADCEKVSECVDALIAVGIGDVTEYKKIIRDLNTDVVAYRALSKADTLEQIIEEQKSLIDEYKHRAEVAEEERDDSKIEYRGYQTYIHYSAADKVLYGKIEGIKDLVNFESHSVTEIEKEFHKAVDDYIEFCREVGKSIDEVEK